MRKNKRDMAQNDISILELDDDQIMATTIQSYFQRTGYTVDVETNPLLAVETLKKKHYDILMLDYLMSPICGDQVVEKVREFDSDIYIILLTGHKNLVPPVRTVRMLDIQGYYEKSDKYDQLEMLVESCVKSIKQLRTIREYQYGMSEMADMLPGIYSSDSYETILGRTAGAISALWHTDDIIVALNSVSANGNPLKIVRGERFAEYENTPVTGLKLMIEADENLSGQLLSASLTDSEGGDIGYIAAVTDEKPDRYATQLFDIFVRQCASSVENMRLNGLVTGRYIELVRGLRQAVDARDGETGGHSDRVGKYASEIARALGCTSGVCERVRLAGQFHDIGKISVPDSILMSDRVFTEEEREAIQNHSAKGAEILSAIPSFAPIVPIVRSHHERYDGSGYPDGLAGENIPYEARIVAVADCFDAIYSKRRYREAATADETLGILRDAAGTQLDPGIVGTFIKLAETTDIISVVSGNAAE